MARWLTLLILWGLPSMGQAQLFFTTNNGAITITGFTGYPAVLVIPSSTNGYPITSIGSNAFWNCHTLLNITIPDRVTSIGNLAFDGCDNLTNVNLGSRITGIGNSAFNGCNRLTNITIPNSVTNIGGGVFIDCGNLTSITIPNGVTSIGDNEFYVCGSLTNVTLGRSVTSIGNYAFWQCNRLTNITLPNSVTSIGNYAFYECGLASITIPDSVTNIGSYAFFSCSNIKNIFFSGNAPSVAPTVFSGDINATVYYLPGTTGWSSTFGGLWAVLWNPQAQTTDGSFGVGANGFGFNITGAYYIPFVVEACTNLAGGNWMPLQTNPATSSTFYFNDPQWTNYPSRLYRLRSP